MFIIQPIFQYIIDGTLPLDKSEARKLRMRVAKYCLLDDKLYRRSYLGPLHRCLRPTTALKVIAQMHGHYANDTCGKAMARRIMLHGYY